MLIPTTVGCIRSSATAKQQGVSYVFRCSPVIIHKRNRNLRNRNPRGITRRKEREERGKKEEKKGGEREGKNERNGRKEKEGPARTSGPMAPNSGTLEPPLNA